MQPGRRHMRVNLRRAEAAVAEQFLDAADVRAGIEQVGGERMPQRVRAGPPVEAGLSKILSQHSGHASSGQPFAESIEKQGGRWLAAGGLDGGSFGQPGTNGVGRRSAEQCEPLFFPLPRTVRMPPSKSMSSIFMPTNSPTRRPAE